MARRKIIDIVAELKYPIKPIDAAVAWGCSVSLARQRLNVAAEEDLLINIGGYSSPTIYAVTAWRDRGLI